LSCLEFFVKRLVFFLALFAVALVNTPPFLWLEAGEIFRARKAALLDAIIIDGEIAPGWSE
jgi:hypothetical protein